MEIDDMKCKDLDFGKVRVATLDGDGTRITLYVKIRR